MVRSALVDDVAGQVDRGFGTPATRSSLSTLDLESLTVFSARPS